MFFSIYLLLNHGQITTVGRDLEKKSNFHFGTIIELIIANL